MGGVSENLRVPRISRTDLGGLPIGPFEGYVLSLVDGKATTQEIADATGADVSDIIKLVDSLREVGAAEWVPTKSRPPLRITTKPPPPPDKSRVLYDPSELYEDDVDLGEERRRAILETFYRLNELNYYDLLKVPRTADKKEIRDSYFRMSKQFHPDTMFGKKLGTFKSKMEAVFNAITSAYEVLGKNKKRVDYDLYLGLTDTTRAAELDLAQAESDAAELERQSAVPMESEQGELVRMRPAKAESEPAKSAPAESSKSEPSKSEPSKSDAKPESDPAGPRAASARDAVPPSEPEKNPSTPARPSQRSGQPPSKPPSISPPGGRSLEERKRIARELMMRRFGGAPGLSSRPTPSRPSSAPKPDSTERSREDVLRGLAGSLRSAARMTGGIDRVAIQVRVARQAEAEGDLVAATNGYRLALSMADDPTVRADYERVRAILAGELAENYEKQAQYEEEFDKWGAAALSWKKVAEGRPQSAEPLCRAANAIIRSGGDLKHAKELAQEAVRLMPGNKKCRIILAQVFIAAGMKRSAKSELEEAGKLDPSDEIVKNLLLDLRD